MKPRRPRASRSKKVIRLWDFREANKSLPYLRTLASALREHWLEANAKRIDLKRLLGKQGRENKDVILARQAAETDKDEAENRFNEDLHEMLKIDVFPVDAVRGVAFIPFAQDNELAWFIFDLFEDPTLQSWRFHKDPLEMRRPITEVINPNSPAMRN